MRREEKRNQGSIKTTLEISFCSQLHWGYPAEKTRDKLRLEKEGELPRAALSLVDTGGFVWRGAVQGFKMSRIFATPSALRGDRKGAAEIDRGHGFRGALLGPRGEGIRCHVRSETAGAAGARVSFLSSCLFQQALSCSPPARGGEPFSPLPLSPCPAPRPRGDQQQACALATPGLPMPSSHSGPNLDPLHVPNFY